MKKWLIIMIAGLAPSLHAQNLDGQGNDFGITAEDESKAVVILVDNVLHEVYGMQTQLAEFCPTQFPFKYETPEKTYYFQNEDLLNRFKACKDLQKTACSHTEQQRQSAATEEENLRKNISTLFEGHQQRLFEAELQKKIETTASQNPLLKLTVQESVDAHLQYLEQHSKKDLLTYFKAHYANPTLGFVHLSQDNVDGGGFILPTLSRFIQKLSAREPKVYEKLKNSLSELHADKHNFGTDRRISKNLSTIYDSLFKYLSEEELRAFTQEFTIALYEALKGDVSEVLRYYPSGLPSELVMQSEELFYPRDKKERIKEIFNEVKQKVIGTVQSKATEPQLQAQTQKALSLLNAVELSWPLDLVGQDVFTGEYLRSMVSTENAAYSPVTNHIKINVPILNAPRWKVFWTLAHEIGHAIDLSKDYSPSFWSHLKECFQKQGFKDHHMGETFSDWLAMEMLTQALESQVPPLTAEEKQEAIFEAVWFCDASVVDEDAIDLVTGKPDPHPSQSRRVNVTMRSHPYLNKLFGCNSSPHYCSGDHP